MNHILTDGKNIKVSAVLTGKKCPWGSMSGDGYKITISTNGKRASFDFWDSYHNMTNNIPVDLRGALSCFALDALAGMNAESADDIASEFGYDKPSETVRVFKGVKKAQKQAERLEFTDDELSELADY
jgi:hypothetical protein